MPIRLLSVLAVLALLMSAPSAMAQEATGQTGILSNLSAVDLSGDSADASLFAGHRLTMVHVWGTYCGNCVSEMPYLGELNAELAPEGFQVVGVVADAVNRYMIAMPSKVRSAERIIQATGASYRHLLPSASLKGLLSGAQYIPYVIFVDETGAQVGQAYTGARAKAQWQGIIESLLAQTP